MLTGWSKGRSKSIFRQLRIITLWPPKDIVHVLKVASEDYFSIEFAHYLHEKKVWFRVLTHLKPPHRFCMLFFDDLPFMTLASSVNGKTSKNSVQKRRGGVWCV